MPSSIYNILKTVSIYSGDIDGTYMIIWVYPVDSSFACNSMKILFDYLILITVDKENHVTSYHRTVKVQRHTFLSSLELWAKEESIGDSM